MEGQPATERTGIQRKPVGQERSEGRIPCRKRAGQAAAIAEQRGLLRWQAEGRIAQ